MPNLYCENDCTKHEVELFDYEQEKLQAVFDDIDYQFKSIEYDENTKEIIIKLKEEDRTKVIEQLMEEELERLKKDNNGR